MGDLASPPAEEPRCPNCGAPAPERFCASCGQEQRSLRVPFRRVVGEALEETLSFDSRLSRTLPALFLHPGLATRHFIEGRRASHTSPLKLYLLASFAFFLALALGPDLNVRVGGGRSSSVKGAFSKGPSGAVAEEGPVTTTPEELSDMRARGALLALFADRLEELTRLPPREARRRVHAALVENAARAMFLLVPLMALVLLALHPRRGFFYTEHLVTAVHAQTVTFALLLPGLAFGSGVLSLAGLALSGGHLLLAMRRVYRTGWAGTAVRWLALSFTYLLAVSLAVAGAALLAVLTG
jgi:hypothetical protein